MSLSSKALRSLRVPQRLACSSKSHLPREPGQAAGGVVLQWRESLCWPRDAALKGPEVQLQLASGRAYESVTSHLLQ